MRSTTPRSRVFLPFLILLLAGPLAACMGMGGSESDYAASTAGSAVGFPSRPNTQGGNAVNGNTAGPNGGTNPNATNSNSSNNAPGAPHVGPPLIQVPLQGCFAADYTAAVRLGDGSSYQMIVDTGSTTLAVAAEACTNCSGISPTYTPSGKATDDRDTASGLYGDGSSWSGEVFSDVVSMGSSNDVTMAFATIDRQSMQRFSGRNFFNASYCSGSAVSNTSQGIIGFGTKLLAAAHTDAYLDEFQTTNSFPDVAAFQFCDLGGNLWLGGYDPGSVSAAPVYTPMNTTNGFYEVMLQDMLMGGTPMGTSANYGSAVVDTGTSVMVVTDELFDTLGTALDNDAQFVSYFGPGFLAQGSCSEPATTVTRAALDAALPKMTLSFPDAQGNTISVAMNATDSYLMAMIQPGGKVGYCAAVSSGGGSGGLPNVLLGNNVMHSQITIFDRANTRLGFGPQVGCSRL